MKQMQTGFKKRRKMYQSIHFDWIADDALIRCFMYEGQGLFLSIRDLIVHLCKKPGGDALKMWHRIERGRKECFKDIVVYHQFPGMGQRDQPVICSNKACVLIYLLPVVNDSWIKMSLNKIRENTCPELALTVTESKKRKADENYEVAAKKPKQELQDTDIELQERLLALEEKRITMQLEAQAAPLDFFRTCNEIAQSLGGWDAKEKARNKSILNSLMDSVYKSNLSDFKDDESISISQVMIKMGVSNVNPIRVGQIASNLFTAKHGMRPSEKYGKQQKVINGQLATYNGYEASDEDLIVQAINMAIGERKDAPARC